MNGDTSEAAAVDLLIISVSLDHKLYVGEGIRSILDSIASIYLSKNKFPSKNQPKLAENEHFPL